MTLHVNLSARGIRFVMRCDNDSGWSVTKAFLRSGAAKACVTLNAPNAEDVRDWGCPADAPALRLVRQVAPNGRVRALATNLRFVACCRTCARSVRALATNLDAQHFPAALFGDL